MAGIKSKLVVIGNSVGIRLPKTLLEQSQIKDEVELIARPHCILIRATTRPRAGWEEQFALTGQLDSESAPDGLKTAENDTRLWKW